MATHCPLTRFREKTPLRPTFVLWYVLSSLSSVQETPHGLPLFLLQCPCVRCIFVTRWVCPLTQRMADARQALQLDYVLCVFYVCRFFLNSGVRRPEATCLAACDRLPGAFTHGFPAALSPNITLFSR